MRASSILNLYKRLTQTPHDDHFNQSIENHLVLIGHWLLTIRNLTRLASGVSDAHYDCHYSEAKDNQTDARTVIRNAPDISPTDTTLSRG